MTGLAFRVSKRSVPAILFGVALVALVGFLVPAALNYLEFYPSLSKVETEITEIGWAGSPGSVNIFMKIDLVSRGQYRGLSVVNLGGNVLFHANGTSRSIGGAGAISPVGLVPSEPVKFDLRLVATGGLADLFVQWAGSEGGPDWLVEISYEVKTFFGDPMAMTYVCAYPGSCSATVGHIPSPLVGGE